MWGVCSPSNPHDACIAEHRLVWRVLKPASRVGWRRMALLAGESTHQAALAIRAQIPIDTLLHGVAQFPTTPTRI